MPLITKADLRSPTIEREFRKQASLTKNAGQVLTENAKASVSEKFDVFLSHSYQDARSLGAEYLLRLKKLLEGHGLTVYVDWINDRQLSRDEVDTATAKLIRARMDQSTCLLFATSESSSESKWMPWELGYKDGSNKRVAILPVVDQRAEKFIGQEYLGLYPYVTRDENTDGVTQLWIEQSDGSYVAFRHWLSSGTQPYRRVS